MPHWFNVFLRYVCFAGGVAAHWLYVENFPPQRPYRFNDLPEGIYEVMTEDDIKSGYYTSFLKRRKGGGTEALWVYGLPYKLPPVFEKRAEGIFEMVPSKSH